MEGRLDCRGAVAGVTGSCRGIGMIDMPSYPVKGFPVTVDVDVDVLLVLVPV
jgi:hypothetical protein